MDSQDPGAGEVEVEVEGAVRRFSAPFTIGRGADQDVVITDDELRVSRVHVSVELDASGWVVHDRSANGTFLSYLRLEAPLPLTHAAVLNLGAADGPAVRLAPVRAPSTVETTAQSAAPAEPVEPSAPAPDPTATVGGLPPDLLEPAGGSALGSLVASRPMVGTIRIGRSADNDIVLAEDLTVSRHHAELQTFDDGTAMLVDVGSRGGTFLDGSRVLRSRVGDGSLIGIGRHLFVLRDGELVEFVDDGVHVDVRDLTVQVPGRTLLDGVTFSVDPGQLVAVVGPSGAGKSTLMRSLTGTEPQAGLAVTYNDRPLRTSMDELRYRIGYVPQDDILHTGLVLRSALRYAADLRFADDVTDDERDERVGAVLGELGLGDRTELRIDRLSGGQRKRASVGLELLTRPSLLLLDEPTSGLDPGFERSVMQLLRGLADEGRTIVVITHAVSSLDTCDRVLFLAPGGRTAFYGPPDEALAYFGTEDYAEVFQRLEGEDRDWAGELRASPAWDRWVVPRVPTPPPPPDAAPRSGRRARAGWWSQVRTLSARGAAVARSSPGYAALLLLQAPVIGALLLVALGTGNLEGPGSGKPRGLITVLVLAATAMGLVNSCREIVRETAIYQRERTVGLSLSAYLLSKFVILGALTLAQTAVLALIVLLPQGGPPTSGVLAPPQLELAVVLFLTSLASVALGLTVSALVKTDAAALVMIPVLIVAQLVFSNTFLQVEETPGLAQVAWASPSYWGTRTLASSSDVLVLEGKCDLLGSLSDADREAVKTFVGEAPCPVTWEQSTANVLIGAGGLVALTIVYAGIAAATLRRRDPFR